MSDIAVNTKLLGLKDVNVHVDDVGIDGRPVVLIHGWPLSGASWSKQVEALQAAGHRVVSYDRRGFGRSDKPSSGYDYDTFTDDLHGLLEELNLEDVTLVGFSMGGGEVARYMAKYGDARIRSVVFAAAIPPMLLKSDMNPEGPLEKAKADEMKDGLEADPESFYDEFTKQFFSANADGTILVSDEERQAAIEMCRQADTAAALGAMEAFATTDFRTDLISIIKPTLIIHGDSDGIVPFEGSGKRTHEAIPQSELHVIKGGPHGINASHADEFNKVLIDFLKK